MPEDVKDKDKNGDPSDSKDKDKKDNGGDDGAKDKDKKEDTVPRSRLNEEIEKKKIAEEELRKARESGMPEDEKKIRDIIEKRDKERGDELKSMEKDQKEEIDKLNEIFGDFNKEKFIDFTEDNPVLGEDGKLDYLKMMNLFQKIGSEGAPKPKSPSSQRTGDDVKKEDFDPTKYRDLHQIAEEAKKEIGS